MKLFRQLRSVFRKSKRDSDMTAEMQAHVDLQASKNEAAGMKPDDARYAALRQFGNVAGFQQEAREQRGGIWLEQFFQDLRHAGRGLRRNPLFTAVAVATLALGLGANTAMFTVFNAVLLRPLPYPEAGNLVSVAERNPETGGRNPVSAGNYLDWLEQNQVFSALGTYTGIGATLRGEQPPQFAAGTRITPGLLEVLRVAPLLGRGFEDGPEAEKNGREILISHALWQTRYGGRPDIVGRPLLLDDTPMTIVGVMPATFEFPARGNDFWLALRFTAEDRESRRTHQWRVLGRLKPGVDRPAAQAAMEVVTHRIARAHPESMAGWGVDVMSYHAELTGNVRPTLLLLAGMVALVLLVACANVANLMLARAAGRQRELAVRGALGAGRGRLVRQLLTEAALLAVIGGGAGLFLAQWILPFLATLAPTQLAGFSGLRLDGAALGFTAAVLLAAIAVVGLAPAWWLSRLDLRSFLQGGRTESGGRVLQRSRNFLLLAQVAVATVLLVGAGLLLRSINKLQRVEIGFDPHQLLAATVNLPRTRYPTTAAQAAFYERLREPLAAIPGVEEVAGISDPPLSRDNTYSFVIAGRPRTGANPRENPVELRAVTPNYFHTVRLPLHAGRTFADTDRADSPGVVIVNQAFAKIHFPDGRVLGQRLSRVGQEGPWFEIVGVVGDLKDGGADQPAAPAIYAPYLQKWEINQSALTAMIRTTTAPERVEKEVRRIFASADPELPIRRVIAVPALYAGQLAQRVFVTRLTAGFAVLTLVLGVIGVYGVVSYTVAQRRREFGICLALGAGKGDIMRRAMDDGGRLVVLGALLGVAGAVGLARFLGNLLFEIEPLDPVTLAGVLLLLGTVSLFALWLPARQAAKADPLVALRAE